MGEYARSLAIAQAAHRRWPHAQIQFVLSRQAPYAAAAPFPAILLDSSPTFHSASVIALIERMRPDAVVFDNAGRTSQLRAAQRAGARVVYISARARQRRKAFRWRWMRIIDEHWIAYPRFIAGRLDVWERFKLGLLRRPVVRYLDVILAPAAVDERGSLLTRLGCEAGAYVLVVPGGGTGHPRAAGAAREFLGAAAALAQTGISTLFIGPSEVAEAVVPTDVPLRCIPSLAQADLAGLMRGARLIIANGGSTLLQSIACGAPCVAIPIAGDQLKRIRQCAAAGVAVEAALDAASIVAAASGLLNDEKARAGLAERAANLKLADGVQIAVDALAGLFDRSAPDA